MAGKPINEQNRKAKAKTLADEIYKRHHKKLLSIGKQNCPSVEDAEEALQDTFILFIDHFDPSSDAPPLAWLTLTLKRRCWATYRRQQFLQQNRLANPTGEPNRSQDAEALDNRHLPDELAAAAENVQRTREQLLELKQDERRALSLLAIGYSYREICDITNWSYTKVNRCISEGRARLRKLNKQTTNN